MYLSDKLILPVAILGEIYAETENTVDAPVINTSFNNRNTSQPVNVATGDIVIQNPVGDVEQFARELKMRIHPTFEKQIYTNLKY